MLVDAGSRYEVKYTSGISHMLQRMAFNGTHKYPTVDSVLATLDPVGGMPNCQRFRDIIIYTVSSLAHGLPQAIDVLAEAVWRPTLSQEQVWVINVLCDSILKAVSQYASLCGGVVARFYARIDLSSIPATALRPCRVNGCVYCEPAFSLR